MRPCIDNDHHIANRFTPNYRFLFINCFLGIDVKFENKSHTNKYGCKEVRLIFYNFLS